MKNKHFIAFIIAGVLFVGGAFEFFKSQPTSSARVKLNQQKAKALEVKAFTVSNQDKTLSQHEEFNEARHNFQARNKNFKTHSAQLADTGADGHNFNKDIKEEDKKKTKKKDAKKKDKKKNKKEDKKVAQKEVPAGEKQQEQEDIAQESTQEVTNSNQAPAVGPALGPQNQADTQNISPQGAPGESAPDDEESQEITRSFEEWASLLLTTPNPQSASELSQLFNQNKISGDTFYQVVEAMIQNENAQISALGLKTAAEAQNSESFIILSEYINGENRPVQNLSYAKQLVDVVYTKPKRLKPLKTILSLKEQDGGDSNNIIKAQILALNTVSRSAQINLNTSNRNPSQVAEADINDIPKYLNEYRQMGATIDELINRSQGELRDSALETKSTLDPLLAQWGDSEAVNTAQL